jgi:hypothetical protein
MTSLLAAFGMHPDDRAFDAIVKLLVKGQVGENTYFKSEDLVDCIGDKDFAENLLLNHMKENRFLSLEALHEAVKPESKGIVSDVLTYVIVDCFRFGLEEGRPKKQDNSSSGLGL